MREICLVPTLNREELLYCCLRRIRESQPEMPIHVFPDRGTYYLPLVQECCKRFEAHAHLVPDNSWYGNTANVMNAYLWAFNEGFDRVFMVESDVMVHPDFFSWHRKQHEEYDDIFCSMAWIFNREAPIVDDELFQNWYYSIGVCFDRKKLELIVRHATPKYYENMPWYIERQFPKSKINEPFAIQHFEQDGLIQRVLDQDRSQSVSAGIAKCSHIGFTRSYGDETGQQGYEEFFGGRQEFSERVALVEEFIADPHWRAEYFGRELVEREIGDYLPRRANKYRVSLPGGWESVFETEVSPTKRKPTKINSVHLPKDAEIVLDS